MLGIEWKGSLSTFQNSLNFQLEDMGIRAQNVNTIKCKKSRSQNISNRKDENLGLKTHPILVSAQIK